MKASHSFSPEKELRRSESEEAALSHRSSESEGLVEDEAVDPQQAETEEEFETPTSSHHFRGSSFGNESETDNFPESSFDRLVTSYEKSLVRQASLDQQLENMHKAHAAQQDIWEARYKRASLELERSSQRIEELKDLVTAKDAENGRLRLDVDELRSEVKEYRQAESRTQEVVRKLEEELAYKDQLAKGQTEKVEELIKYFTKDKKQSRPATKSPAPSPPPRSKSPCCTSNPGRYNGVYLLRGSVTSTQHRQEDRGKQEVRMPFLSHSTDNWVSSLRSVGSPGKPGGAKGKVTMETSKESGEFIQREGEELPNFAFFLSKF